jgi:cell division protein FtsI/penicillin-binding protein 2
MKAVTSERTGAPEADGLWDAGGCMSPNALLHAYAGIANRGRTLSTSWFSERTAADLTGALRQAVTDGTGQRARSTKLTTAGKTATSLGTSPTCATGQRVASFVGFAPVEAPQWVVLAAIIEPDDTQPLGGRYAAPLFRDVVEGLSQR